MGSKELMLGIAILLGMQALVLSKAEEQSGGLHEALNHAGGNRIEMETVLRKVKGKDTEYLISHASQHDLVNLTAEQIAENITYARKVHVALPYLGGELDYDLWREWVLPHRVLDEDLCLWRKDFYERLQPVIVGKKSAWEVVVAIHAWLMIGQDGNPPRIVFGPSENRGKSPIQMLEMGSGACGELSKMMVYLLRAVGIPARHCLVCWRYGGPTLHYYCEYWDPQLGRWVPVEASDAKPLTAIPPHERPWAKMLGALTFYAHPGFPTSRDSYSTSCFDQCVPVTANMYDVKPVGFETPDGFSGTATAYVWNSGAWQSVAQGSAVETNELAIQIAAEPDSVFLPVLYSVTDGKTLLWGMQRPTLTAGNVELKQALPGECLRWTNNEGL